MSQIMSKWIASDVVSAIESNLFEMLTLFASFQPSGLDHGGERVRFMTGLRYPALNGIFRARLADEGIDVAIESLLAPFKEHQVPMFWWVGPSTEPRNLSQRLEAHDLVRAGRLHGMAIDLAHVAESVPAHTTLIIERVRDPEMLDAFFHLLRRDGPMPRTVAAALFGLFCKAGFQEDSLLHHYVAWYKGEPVACCSMLRSAPVAGLYNVATLPAMRGRGIASAMVLTALGAARAVGCHLGVLESLPSHLDLYRRLGFIEHCRIDVYAWPGEGLQASLLS
jgi:GNAT superfamily N-acetyltransferase